MPGVDGFLAELRKRGVLRAALIYVAAAFAVLEFADIAFPRLGLPDDAVSVVLWIGIAGFPLALFGAWAIELRAQVDRGRMRHWLSPTTVGVAAGLVGLGLTMGYWWGGESNPDAVRPDLASRDRRAPAVAVLRFASAGDTDALFAAGLSEEIGSVLADFPGIRVIAPSATSYFDEADRDLRALDDELGVRYLLRGSVRRSVDRVRVAAQLLDASTGDQLWGDRYDAELMPARLFETQDEIARRVASSIGDASGAVLQHEQRKVRRLGTESLEAYDCVLLGQAYLNVHTEAVQGKARRCLERAVEIDPDYADAWAHLAYLYREEFLHYYPGEPDPLQRSLAAARKALTLQPNNPMAHFAMGFTLASLYRLDAAIVQLEKLVAVAPNDSAMMGGASIYLAHAGRWERALEIADLVEQLNPLHNGWVHYTRALAHFREGNFEAALTDAKRLPAPHAQTDIHLAANYARLGQVDAARRATEDLIRDPHFAADPTEYLRRIFLRDVAIERYTDALRLAGVEIEPGEPARLSIDLD